MTKAQLVGNLELHNTVMDVHVSKKDLGIILDNIGKVVTKVLEDGDSINFAGLGSFSTVETKERECFNPSTREKITVPASRKVKFKPSSTLKNLIKS